MGIEFASKKDNEKWIPLVEFAAEKGVSLSTLRRYIKANKIKWKLVDGRYLVCDSADGFGQSISIVSKLEAELRSANQELAELKTLLAFYEEKWSQNSTEE